MARAVSAKKVKRPKHLWGCKIGEMSRGAFIFAFLSTPIFAQIKRTDLLRKVKETYRDARQYQFSSHLVQKRSGGESITGSEELAVDATGRVWLKAVGGAAVAETGGREQSALIVLADAGQVLIYLEHEKVYKRVDGNPEPRDADLDDDSIDNPKFFARKVMDASLVRYEKFETMASRAKIVREDRCNSDVQASQCYVIEIGAYSSDPKIVKAAYTLWINKQNYLVLRDDFEIVDTTGQSLSVSIVYDIARINAEIPERTFSFKLPPGVQEVSSFFQ